MLWKVITTLGYNDINKELDRWFLFSTFAVNLFNFQLLMSLEWFEAWNFFEQSYCKNLQTTIYEYFYIRQDSLTFSFPKTSIYSVLSLKTFTFPALRLWLHNFVKKLYFAHISMTNMENIKSIKLDKIFYRIRSNNFFT